MQFFTNHIGHFMLVTGLLEQLSESGRVVVLSSDVHRRAPKSGIDFANLNGSQGYNGWTAYGQSKFANLLFAKELARRFIGSKRTANAIHPGVIKTNLARNMNPMMSALLSAFGPLVLKNVAQGAATQVYAATSPELADVSGQYLSNCNLAVPRADANDQELASKLWALSETIAAKVSCAAS
jgi:WW domain-containing oxidoreductase